MSITKAVFPVAGFGSRFLPATKATPKEMIPIVDKPLIQYAVEEAYRAGIRHMIFVTNYGKRAIEDHFDHNFELEESLKERNKMALLDVVRSITPNDIHFTYVRQNQALGLGHAVYCAKHVVGDEPFALLLADDLLDDENALTLKSMIELYNTQHASIIACERVPREKLSRYGVVDIDGDLTTSQAISGIIEKPKPQDAPSDFGVMGRYVLSPAIFERLEQEEKDHGGEIQLTNAIAKLLKEESVYAYLTQAKRYDCGSKLGFLEATVDFGLKHPELKTPFANFLKAKLSEHQVALA